MEIRAIHNDEDLTWALKRIDELWEAEAGTPADDELDVLSYLVDRYESVHYPIPRSTPLEMLRFFMEQGDRSQSDLANLLGSRSRASEILNGRKDLTLAQIRKLHREWHIPVGSLIGGLVDA